MTEIPQFVTDSVSRGVSTASDVPSWVTRNVARNLAERYPDEGIAGDVLGTVAGMGKGVVEGTMSLARGAHWLLSKAVGITNPVSGKVLESIAPSDWSTDVRDYLPKDTALRLESRLSQSPVRGVAEGLGGLLPLLSGGGMGVVGKATTLPGRAISEMAAPGMKLGEALMQASPTIGAWAKGAGAVTKAASLGTSFGIYNFVTAEGGVEQRAAAAMHGVLSGAGLYVLGGIARAAEAKILSYGTTYAQKQAAAELLGKFTEAGRAKVGADAMRFDSALVGSLIEGTGFAGLNKQFWVDVIDGAKGDAEASKRAAEVWAGSVIGVLFARTGQADIGLRFRREAPELNTMEPRLQALLLRDAGSQQGGARGSAPQGPPQGGPTPKALEGTDAVIPAAQRQRMDEAWARTPKELDAKGEVGAADRRQTMGEAWQQTPRELGAPEQVQPGQLGAGQKQLGAPEDPKLLGAPAATISPETAAETAYRLPGLQQASDPLFKSGWDLKSEVEIKDGAAYITMEFPGAGAIRMWENEGATGPAGEALGLEVPVSVFRQVRGDVKIPEGTENIRMVGEAAQEFLQHLTTVSLLRRIRGELYFGQNGEAYAGGPWRGQDGQWHTIGLDGKHYSKSPLDDAYKGAEEPTLPLVENPASQDPQMARWVELAQVLEQHTAATPGRDLLEASLMLAVNGAPNSRSVQELWKLLAAPWQPGSPVMNADLAAEMLRPDTIDQFGLTIGQVAAGHLTAERAAFQLGTALAGSKPGTQLQAPPADQPGQPAAEQPPQEPAPTGDQLPAKPMSIAGTRDWFTAPPNERRAAARFYAESRPDVTANVLRDTFGIPRETARDIIGKRGTEQGPFKPSEGGFGLGPGAIKEMAEEVGDVVTAPVEGIYRNAIQPQTRKLADLGGPAGREAAMKFREMTSRKRGILGKAGKFAKTALKTPAAKKLRGAYETKDAQGKPLPYDRLRYRDLIEGKIQPANDAERTFAEEANKSLLVLQHTAVGAGMMRAVRQQGGGYQWQAGQKAGRATVPYQYSSNKKRGYYAMLNDPAARQSFYERLEQLNPGITAAELEGAYLKRKTALDIENPESVAAYEIQRQIKHMPATHTHGGTTWEVLEPDPAIALHSIMERQAGRAAAMQVVGQDLPEAVRRMHNITKPGMTKFLSDLQDTFERSDVPGDKADLKRTALNLAERIQGREPNPLGPAGRAVAEVQNVFRAILAWPSGLYDVSSMVTEPQVYVGVRNVLRAYLEILRGVPSDAAEFGSLSHELGNVDLGASRSILSHIAEIISSPSNWMERWKTSFFDRSAKIFVARLRAGKDASQARQVLVDDLHFTEAEAAQLMSNNAPQALYDQVRRELVVRMTNRGRMEERSAAAADPTVRNWVAYMGYSTMRMDQLVNDVAGMAKRAASPKSTVADRATAVKRAIYRGVGIPLGGVVGLALSYLLADLLRGEPVDGAKRIARDLANYPLGTIAKASLGQVASGPIGMIASSVTEGQPERLASMVTGLNVIAAAMDSYSRGGGNPFDTMSRFMAGIGMLPRQHRDVFFALQAAIAGQSEFTELSRTFNEWRQKEGIQPAFGEKDKKPAFYAAMQKVREMIGSSKGDVSKLAPEIEAEIKKALDLQPGENVAAKLRSMRFLSSDLDQKQILKLIRYAGQGNFDKIVHHDEMLTALAREVGRRTGTYPTDFSDDIETATQLAASGTPNSWGKLIDRVVREKAEELFSGTPAKSDIQELAMAIADHKESIDNESGFSDVNRMDLKAQRNRLALSHMVATILREKAMNRAENMREKAAQKK